MKYESIFSCNTVLSQGKHKSKAIFDECMVMTSIVMTPSTTNDNGQLAVKAFLFYFFGVPSLDEITPIETFPVYAGSDCGNLDSI